MESAEQPYSDCQHIYEQVALISHDDDAEVEIFDDLVETEGWDACYDCLISILLDEKAGEALWQTSASLLFAHILEPHPVEDALVIGLAYLRLPLDEGSSESNLAWSIAVKLKDLDYTLSDYNPRTDPKVLAALERCGLSFDTRD
jgi:hypothetical protein